MPNGIDVFIEPASEELIKKMMDKYDCAVKWSFACYESMDHYAPYCWGSAIDDADLERIINEEAKEDTSPARKALVVFFDDGEYGRVYYKVFDDEFALITEGCFRSAELKLPLVYEEYDVERALKEKIELPRGYKITKVESIW